MFSRQAHRGTAPPHDIPPAESDSAQWTRPATGVSAELQRRKRHQHSLWKRKVAITSVDQD
jgi:hypothetical protein